MVILRMNNFFKSSSTVKCVNCTALQAGPIQEVLQLSEEEFKKIVKINMMASWFLMKAVCRRMRDQKSGGSIVFLSSLIGSERGLYPGAAAFGSCSAGLQQLARVSNCCCSSSSLYFCIIICLSYPSFKLHLPKLAP